MQIKKCFENGWIEPISSPYGSPILFVNKKEDEVLQMVIDYCALNKQTIQISVHYLTLMICLINYQTLVYFHP